MTTFMVPTMFDANFNVNVAEQNYKLIMPFSGFSVPV